MKFIYLSSRFAFTKFMLYVVHEMIPRPLGSLAFKIPECMQSDNLFQIK
jgi:hypothetical protein